MMRIIRGYDEETQTWVTMYIGTSEELFKKLAEFKERAINEGDIMPLLGEGINTPWRDEEIGSLYEVDDPEVWEYIHKEENWDILSAHIDLYYQSGLKLYTIGLNDGLYKLEWMPVQECLDVMLRLENTRGEGEIMNVAFLFNGVQVLGLYSDDTNKREFYIQSKDKKYWLLAGTTKESLTKAYNEEYK